MKKKHQPGCPCCFTAIPCFCTSDPWDDFQIGLAGFVDGAIAGLAALLNGTHLIPRLTSQPAICSGEISFEETLLWPSRFAGCPQCTDTGDGTIRIYASIRPKGLIVPGGPSIFNGLRLHAFVGLLGRQQTCYGTSFDHYVESWSWDKDIPIVDCLDIDENLPLSYSTTLPSYFAPCSVGNVNGSAATCNFQLA